MCSGLSGYAIKIMVQKLKNGPKVKKKKKKKKIKIG